VVGGSQLLHELLVLVQLLEVGNAHAGDGVGLGIIAVLIGTENAYGVALTGDEGQLDGTSEALLLNRVEVLQTDLQFDGLNELALLFGGTLDDGSQGLIDDVARDFAHVA